MKLTKSQLKQVIKEELDKVLNEDQSEPFTVTHEDYDSSAQFQFKGFRTPYDQTFASFNIKLGDGKVIETGKMLAGLDTEELAQNLASEIFSADEGYWFLNPDYAGEEDYNIFVGALQKSLEEKDIDPESQSEEMHSYRDRDSGGF